MLGQNLATPKVVLPAEGLRAASNKAQLWWKVELSSVLFSPMRGEEVFVPLPFQLTISIWLGMTKRFSMSLG